MKSRTTENIEGMHTEGTEGVVYYFNLLTTSCLPADRVR